MKFERIQFEEIPEYGDKMPIKHWIGTVEAGGFIDYDGHGNLATEDRMYELQVKPSFVKDKKITMAAIGFDWDKKFDYEDDWKFTHVVWFNR